MDWMALKTEIYILTSVGQKFKIKILAGLVSSESSLIGFHMATCFLGPHVTFSLSVNIPGVFSANLLLLE